MAFEQYERDENGFIIIPEGAPNWYDLYQENQRLYGAALADKAAIGPLEWFNVQLSEDYNEEHELLHFCQFCKDQNNKVYLHIAATTKANTPIAKRVTQVCNLPEGFIPCRVTHMPAIVHNNTDMVACVAVCYLDGSVKLHYYGTLPGRAFIFFQGVFYTQ